MRFQSKDFPRLSLGVPGEAKYKISRNFLLIELQKRSDILVENN
tara:strand:+ start:74 stop:205 length:132 start_codon:yes stop_codon:yes gene_type:complete